MVDGRHNICRPLRSFLVSPLPINTTHTITVTDTVVVVIRPPLKIVDGRAYLYLWPNAIARALRDRDTRKTTDLTQIENDFRRQWKHRVLVSVCIPAYLPTYLK